VRPIRVVAVTQSDPFFTGRFFETFLPECASLPIEVVEIVLLRNFNESRTALAARLWKLYGTLDMIRLMGRYAYARAEERLGTPRSVEAVATKYAIPTRALTTINDPPYLRTLALRGIDVLLSVAAPEIFRPATLTAAPLVLNVHCGKLPQYRGMMPTFWALHRGEQEITITVHTMGEKIDRGDVLAEYPVAIRPEDTAFDLAARAKDVAGREVARLLSRLDSTGVPARPMPSAQQRYFTFPTRRHAQELRAAGRRML
jgi:methionyl-tRNA formyltransferase